MNFSKITTTGYGFQIDMVAETYAKEISIAQVPITFTERETGSSKMSLKIAIEAAVSVTRQALQRLLIRR